MAAAEDVLVSVFMELARIAVIIIYFKSFCVLLSRKKLVIYCTLSYVLTLAGYLIFHNVYINISFTLIGIFIIAMGFSGSKKKKLLLVIMCYAILFAADMLASFMFDEKPESTGYELISSVMSVMISYVVVILIRGLYGKKGNNGLTGQWYYLLLVALLSIGILHVIYQSRSLPREPVMIVSTMVLILNVILYYFYNSMMDAFTYNQENILLKKQMDIYDAQIRADIDNNRIIKSIRHDMKHHIRELDALIDNGEYEKIKEYLSSMMEDIHSAQRVINTGNNYFDAILNYYADKAVQRDIEFKTDIIVPEDFNMRTYDLNIIMGNLLDNALENTIKANKSNVNLSIRYANGLLDIIVSNTYQGKIQKESNHFISSKNEEHGFGIENVKRMVEKYNGEINIDYDGNMFTARVVIYI